MARPPVPMLQRLWAKVRKTDTCWLWTAGKEQGGYGVFWRGNRFPSGQPRSEMAHRVMYELLVGPIPDGLQLDHLCRNRACVNPAHLEPVTPAENLRRSDQPGALAVRTGMCKRGHAFTPENTYSWRGHRHCRTCRNKNATASYAAA